jgi:hypothetical protein
MGNELPAKVKTGTIGELLVQLRLLQYGIQAAPPIKDSGNDLIAAYKGSFRAIQVKTSTNRKPRVRNLPKYYDIIALVNLNRTNDSLNLDASKVYLLPRDVFEASGVPHDLSQHLLCQDYLVQLFPPVS